MKLAKYLFLSTFSGRSVYLSVDIGGDAFKDAGLEDKLWVGLMAVAGVFPGQSEELLYNTKR